MKALVWFLTGFVVGIVLLVLLSYTLPQDAFKATNTLTPPSAPLCPFNNVACVVIELIALLVISYVSWHFLWLPVDRYYSKGVDDK